MMKQVLKTQLLLFFLLLSILVWSQDDEFSEFDNQQDTVETLSQSDEFGESTNEFSDDSDEFGESTDEFSSQNDEFSEFSEGDVLEEKAPVSWNRFYWALSILAFTILAGIFVRFEKTRKLRPLFLLAAVVILGFYRGGPGIISSFQNTYLYAIGATLKWPAIILFLGLLPITYFFGKVFCGWACYLGAIQEFLYIGKFKVLQTEKAQKIMRIIRYVILVLLLIQLTISQGIEWSKIGPFKVIFNLYSPNITGYVLLVILLISSLFIHRPFCKIVCPAGLIFGWITKIPGASVLGITESCAGCKTCNTSCNINAITRDGKTSTLDNQECIMCGDCMSDCKIKSIQPFKKGKNHEGNITLKGIKKLDIS
jgi:ferredoxin